MRTILILIMFCVGYSIEFAIAGEIKWEVSTPYPLLSSLNEADQKFWIPKNNEAGGIESFDEWYQRVSTASHSPYFEMDKAARPWDSVNHRYRESFLKQYVHSKTIRVTAQVEGVTGDCQWRMAGVPILNKPCNERVPLDVAEGGSLVEVAQNNSIVATQTVNPKRIIVLGIGDSYSSGEGNPDKPTSWKSMPVAAGDYSWLKKSSPHMAEPAEWLDQQCHRSFWNYQNYTALRLAAESKTREVVFLHYSCSGAEVFDGMLVKQMNPPGSPAGCNAKSFGSPECMVHVSQLHAAVADLCPDTVSPNDNASLRDGVDLGKLYRMESYKNLGLDLVKCTSSRYRQPDAILLSIGGNDAGFASLVAWALLPSNGYNPLTDVFFQNLVRKNRVVCPDLAFGKGCKRPSDIQLINQLARRYKVLNRAITSLLNVPGQKVVLNGYPDPIRKTSVGDVICHDERGLSNDNAWDGSRIFTKLVKSWHFNILDGEARVLLQSTIKPLNRQLSDIGKALNYQYAFGAADAFVGHGWCEASVWDSPIYLPSTPGRPWLEGDCANNPSCWKPYWPRARFIRTVNDTLMTQTSELDDGLTGSMHPTARGHAAVADATYNNLKSIIGY